MDSESQDADNLEYCDQHSERGEPGVAHPDDLGQSQDRNGGVPRKQIIIGDRVGNQQRRNARVMPDCLGSA